MTDPREDVEEIAARVVGKDGAGLSGLQFDVAREHVAAALREYGERVRAEALRDAAREADKETVYLNNPIRRNTALEIAARIRALASQAEHSKRCTENADDPACPHPTCLAGGEP